MHVLQSKNEERTIWYYKKPMYHIVGKRYRVMIESKLKDHQSFDEQFEF